MILVEKLRSFISASGCGVTSPLNRASNANGTDGGGVEEEVGEVTGVAVSIKLVGLLPGVFGGAGVCVISGDANGVWVLNKGIEGWLDFGSWEKTTSKTPAATKVPRIEKATRARTVFCWRVM